MTNLVTALVLPIYIACTNCNGVGYFEIECSRCGGKGRIVAPFKRRVKDVNGFKSVYVPCPECSKGLYSSTSKKVGTGKKKITCKVCHGNKKIRP